MDLTIAPDDPRRPDVVALLEVHLAFMHATSPPEHVHALDLEGLCDPAITFLSARTGDGTLVAIGALRQLDATHAEVKSMHTVDARRGSGVARRMLDALLDLARDRGCTRVSLETGAEPAFAPARALYESVGFRRCPPFGDYWENDHSVCMTLALDEGEGS